MKRSMMNGQEGYANLRLIRNSLLLSFSKRAKRLCPFLWRKEKN